VRSVYKRVIPWCDVFWFVAVMLVMVNILDGVLSWYLIKHGGDFLIEGNGFMGRIVNYSWFMVFKAVVPIVVLMVVYRRIGGIEGNYRLASKVLGVFLIALCGVVVWNGYLVGML